VSLEGEGWWSPQGLWRIFCVLGSSTGLSTSMARSVRYQICVCQTGAMSRASTFSCRIFCKHFKIYANGGKRYGCWSLQEVDRPSTAWAVWSGLELQYPGSWVFSQRQTGLPWRGPTSPEPGISAGVSQVSGSQICSEILPAWEVLWMY